MIVRVVSGQPRLGCELDYILALKHREGWSGLLNRTPWYQFAKKKRRMQGWLRAIDRYHHFGIDLVYRLN